MYLNPEGCLRIGLTPQESDIRPRSRVIAASNQNDFLHLLDPQFKMSCKGEPAVDMLHHPLAKSIQGEGVLPLSLHQKG